MVMAACPKDWHTSRTILVTWRHEWRHWTITFVLLHQTIGPLSVVVGGSIKWAPMIDNGTLLVFFKRAKVEMTGTGKTLMKYFRLLAQVAAWNL